MLTARSVRRSFVAVLLVVLASAGLPGCGVLGGSRGDSYRLTAYFDKAVSLYPQSSVKVLGLRAGTVTDVDVVGDQVRVRMRIDGAPVPAGARATLVPLSLIGERYVQLFPAWKEGDPTLAPGSTIPIERTSIPTEPDEALAALKEFLDALDPSATGRLVRNVAADLDGNGQGLGEALGGLSELATHLADKDAQLVAIIDSFDTLTATLRTREVQLGRVLDQFATATALLARERATIEQLVKGLASVATDGLDLISEHRAALERDISILTRTLASVQANLGHVGELLDAGPLLVAGPALDGKLAGLAAAYDPKYHHIDLRNQVAPTAAGALDALGIPGLPRCLPIDVSCPVAATARANGTAPNPTANATATRTQAAGSARPAAVDPPAAVRPTTAPPSWRASTARPATGSNPPGSAGSRLRALARWLAEGLS